MSDVALRPYAVADRDWMVARHGALYAESDGFDDSFPRLVSQILDDFAAQHDGTCERGWIAERGGDRLGSIFCVRLDPQTAKLRLFFLEPAVRGQGLGRRMLETATAFARDTGCRQMRVWTHESHRAACRLYAAAGWRCEAARPVHSFGVDLVEQSWSRTL